MSSNSKKVTYKYPIDENNDYLVPLQYEYKSTIPIQSRYPENVSSSSPSPATDFFGLIYFPVSLILYVGIPISQFVIGLVYIGQCPVQQIIVVWMIVSGIFGILLVIIGIIIHIQSRKLQLSTTSYDRSQSNRIILYILKPLFAVILLFIIAWFFAGQVFVFQAKLRVEFFDSTLPEYCHENLYKAAYILIFIDYLIFLLAIILNVLSYVAPPDDGDKNNRHVKKHSTHNAKK
ncbi:unnamed protein product [Adineta steineri]|uniref:Uncharacterized protein n=1 Tax=Adineta steineri TaxID=433720 RepID=A0A814HFW9_9BILA|nr:unnamed protein product [Adineta steineri]CAF4044079.1 unnamed protein product [Adineta steineri]